MDFFKHFKKVETTHTPKGDLLALAKQKKKTVQITYTSRFGRKSKRTITPLQMYANSAGVFYVKAFCQKAKEERVFLLENIDLVDETEVLPESRNQKATSSSKSINANDRPLCTMVDCKNLAEIKERSGDKVKYRKLCTTCRKKPIGEIAKSHNNSKSVVLTTNQSLAERPKNKKRIVAEPSINPESFEMADTTENTTDLNADLDFMKDGLRQLQIKLLDLSRKNNLVNFQQSDRQRRLLRVVDETPSSLLSSLINDKMEFMPLPGTDEEPEDEKTEDFKLALETARVTDKDYLAVLELAEQEEVTEDDLNKALRELKDRVREQLGLPIIRRGNQINIKAHALAHGFNPDYDLPGWETDEKHSDAYIQTLLFPEDLNKRLKSVHTNYKEVLNDKGLNVFYAAFGMLKWFDSESSDKENLSPLILLPIEIEKKKSGKGHRYLFSADGAEPIINQTVYEKLRLEHGVALPQLFEDGSEGEEKDLNIEAFYEEVRNAISSRKRWEVKRFVSFGFFNYQDIAIFNDLQPDNWADENQLVAHSLIAKLLGGLPANETSSIEKIEDIDRLTLAKELPHLVLPADSSQHSAIINALDGKPLVIQGPPGTGKSQTIANLIAALTAKKKKILFLAEKQPALNVVKDRLVSVGLGTLIFDPKVSGNKSEIYEAIERRMELEASFDKAAFEFDTSRLRKVIERSRDYQTYVSEMTDYAGKEFYELVWTVEGASDFLKDKELPFYLEGALDEISKEELQEMFDYIERYTVIQRDLPSKDYGIYAFKGIGQNPVELQMFKQSLQHAVQVGEDLENHLAGAMFSITDATFKSVIRSIELVRSLRETQTTDDLSWLLNLEDPLSKLGAVKDSNKELDKMIAEKSFLKAADLEISDKYFQLTASLDNAIITAPVLSDSSVDHLRELNEETSAKSAAITECVSELIGVSPSLKGSTFNQIVSLREGLEVVSYDKWHSLIPFLSDDAFRQDALPQLKQLIAEIAAVKAEIDNLPRAVNFDDVFERFTVDELEDLLASFEKINLFSSLGSKAKQTKTLLKKLGVEASNKELTIKWVQRLTDCLSAARALETNVNKTILLKDGFTHIFNRRRDLQNILSALNYMHGETLSDDCNIFRQLKPTAFFNVSDIVMTNRNLIDELNETFASELSSCEIGDLARQIEDASEASEKIVAAADELELPEYAKLSDLSKGKSFEDLYRRYFDLIDRVTFDNIGRLGIEDTKKLLSSSKLCAELCAIAGKDVAVNLLLSSDEGAVSELETAARKYQTTINDIGIKYDNQTKAEFNVAESEDTLNRSLSQLKDIVAAPNSELYLLLKNASMRNEFEQTLDSHFFTVLGEFRSLNDSVTFEDAKNLFVLRTGRNILGEHSKTHQLPINIADELGAVGANLIALDKRIAAHAKDEALNVATSANVPRGVDYGAKRNWTELSLINNELSKKRRIAVRQLIKRSSNALLGLMPVWFMNPVAASQYLPRTSGFFDVLIIDEASQMLPEKAIAALARTKTVIVVGDNKQMPPTNWLKATVDFGDDEDEEVEAESILDLAQQRIGNSVSLNWHYRSRHPSLINFSNHKFYDGRLEVFPTPNVSKSSLGVKGIKVDGVYKGNVNQTELKEVMLQARTLMERYPDESLGIVAINSPQTELIKQALENTDDPIIREYIDRWDNDPLNSVFVKNLDNVQGDERDNIIISTVYGKDEEGNLYQRFASVVSQNGHRRLNVLVTRSKNRVILVTSLNANDIKIDEKSQPGKKIFRDYIEYAMTGKLATGENLRQLADSDFEIAVGRMLEEAGFEVTPQVGVKGFRIDLGVSHPAYPHGYLAGIECDGATFHSSASARDRDAIRQDILESLGWKIYRIWSTDWFASPAEERDKVLAWLHSIIKNTATSKPIELPVNVIEDPISNDNRLEEENPELQQDNLATTQAAGPSGAKGELDIEGEIVNYWKPMDGLYELWIDNQLIGFTEMEEIELAQANTSFADQLKASRVRYSSELLVPNRKQAEHDKFEIGLRWVYRQYLDASK